MKQSSPFTLVNSFGSNCYNCFWYRIVWPDWSNRRWQRFPSILSITERGMMPYEQTVQFSQDEVLLRMRWSQIPSYLFRSGRDFPVQTFLGLMSLIGTTYHGQVWSWAFSSIISCPLVYGSSREMWLLLGVLPTNWYHVSWPYWQEIMSIYLTEEHATCLLFTRLCRFRCQGPLPINSWFPSLPSSFLKFPSSINLVLDPRLEVSCVHKFPSS